MKTETCVSFASFTEPGLLLRSDSSANPTSCPLLECLLTISYSPSRDPIALVCTSVTPPQPPHPLLCSTGWGISVTQRHLMESEMKSQVGIRADSTSELHRDTHQSDNYNHQKRGLAPVDAGEGGGKDRKLTPGTSTPTFHEPGLFLKMFLYFEKKHTPYKILPIQSYKQHNRGAKKYIYT